MGLVKDDTFIFHLKPLHGILFCHPMLNSNPWLASSATTNTVTWALKDNKEIHTINTSWRIIPVKEFQSIDISFIAISSNNITKSHHQTNILDIEIKITRSLSIVYYNYQVERPQNGDFTENQTTWQGTQSIYNYEYGKAHLTRK